MNKFNPFISVGPIADPKLFFNRKAMVEVLLNNLLSGKPACLSIVGQRKIGKTSLGLHLARASIIEEFGFNGRNYIFSYLNCQKNFQALKDVESFIRILLKNMISAVRLSSPELTADLSRWLLLAEKDVMQCWDEFLDYLWSKSYYIVVVFDEFDIAIMQENLIKGGLFGSLRGYANDSPNFSWVTITSRLLHVIFEEAFTEFKIPKSVRIAESDFFNIATPQIVKLFDEDETKRMIQYLTALREVTFPEETLQAIINCGGGFPYFVQRAGYHFYNSYLTNSLDQALATQNFIQESIPIWEGFWNKLDSRQQHILSAVASGNSTVASDYEINNLIDSSMIYEDRSRKLQPFSYEFGRFVLSKSIVSNRLFEVGECLNGRYQILNIKTTEHSQITKAWDEKLKRFVAIKTPRVDLFTFDGKAIDRLQKNLRREAELLAKLRNQNIGQVFDIIEEPIGVVMEWVDGRPLQDLLDDKENLSIYDILMIGMGIASALVYVHHEGVIHRDIKPNNIILTINKTSKLIDFDIARDELLETITMLEDGTRFQVGTPTYSSPEQLTRPEEESLNEVGPASDIFSLGVVLYELLTFERPYKYGNRLMLYGSNFPKPDPHDIPKPLYRILCKMLDGKPAKRPTAESLKSDLQKCLQRSQNPTSLDEEVEIW